MKRLLLTVLLVALLAPASAQAGSSVRFGIQDDAWLAYGPGSLEQRLLKLDRLGVDLVRFTVEWNRVAAKRPQRARDHGDPAYDWAVADTVLRGLRKHGIAAVVGLNGSPAWANGHRAPNWAPSSGASMADFAYAAARRYSWVRDLLIWNEPNQRRWLLPTSPAVYTARILNPAYAGIHAANRRARVGGGVTAPRGNAGGSSPVEWIRGMKRAGAKLDAYAHHPYPLDPRRDTPFSGGCDHCTTITMASLERLIREVSTSFPGKRIWLTEFGYQTNPPDRQAGVSPAAQARFIGEAALRVYRAPLVDMLIHYLVQDEPDVGRWQSGLQTVAGRAKPAMQAFALPLAQLPGSRQVWGQVRPRGGSQVYRLQYSSGGTWRWLGGTARTSSSGAFYRTVAFAKGTRVRIWSPRDRAYSAIVTLR